MAGLHRRTLEFRVRDRVFIKVLPTRRVNHFDKHGSLIPRFIGLFEIVERVEEVAYKLVLPSFFGWCVRYVSYIIIEVICFRYESYCG